MESLVDLADKIGFDAIDAEVSVWIEMGEFDKSVTQRAQDMGIAFNERQKNFAQLMENDLQFYHRIRHPDGPYGWEFCARCPYEV